MTDDNKMRSGSAALTQKRGVDLLPDAWRWAFLLGPWALMVGGVVLVVAAFLWNSQGSFATTCLTLGVATGIAGCLLPRASGKFSVAGATANVYGVSDAIKDIAEIASATIPDSDPDKEEKVRSAVTKAAQVLASPSPAANSGLIAGNSRGVAHLAPVTEEATTLDSPILLTDLVKEVFDS